MRVLSSRPTEADSALAFLGLHDLLVGTEDAVERLPPPQRDALEVALLRKAPAGGSSDGRAVHVAVVELVRALSRDRPVLIAVDDLHWLDEGTSRILDHVARRLEVETVGFLVTVRGPAGDVLGIDLSSLPGGRVGEVELAPLPDDELDRIVGEHVPGQPSPHSIDELHALAAGNPFFAIEIARSSIRGEVAPTGQRLPIPKSLKDDLLRHRVARLPDQAREALFVASALSRPTVDLVTAAMGAGSAGPDLEPAVRLDLIEVQGGEIRFTHPLFASAIYSDGARDRRHRLHRRLAEIVEDPEQIARHRALGADGPDLDIVAALEAAAAVARDRGSPRRAAELCGLAPGVLPPDHPDRSVRIRLAQSDFLIEAGDHDAAAEILAAAVAEVTGDTMAEVLFRLARAYAPIDPERTTRAITDALAVGRASSLLHPRTEHLVPDVAEALVLAGAFEEAAELIEWMLRPPVAGEPRTAAAPAIRCRALLLAGTGRIPEAIRALDASLATEGELEPFERGRSFLARGIVRRRATQRRGARDDLRQAIEIFRDLDAEPWVSLAQGEMAKISGRKPATSALTEAEARVARLAIAGLTNREIAGSLFMSVRTVEGHLSHSYAKLGVRSRTELAAIFDR
jgi:DNA-binding CsgD family transcriptional regulator